MRDARILLIPVMMLALGACQGEKQPDENLVITDINAAEPGDIEALPPDESVDPAAEDAVDLRPPEETGGSESTRNQG